MRDAVASTPKSGHEGRLGNLVYLGMPWSEICNLMLGRIPDIEGREALYPSMALQCALSAFVDPRKMTNGCQQTFHHFQLQAQGKTVEECPELAYINGYYDATCQTMRALRFLDEENQPAMPPTALMTAWELRWCLPESLTLCRCLDMLMQEFVHNRSRDYGENEEVQADFLLRLLHIFERRPCPPGIIPLDQTTYITKSDARMQSWAEWEELIGGFQDEIRALPDELKAALLPSGGVEGMLLSHPIGQPLDPRAFQVIKSNRMATDLSSIDKHILCSTLFGLGSVVLKMYNCLHKPGTEYEGLGLVLRKCFNRIKYILRDITRAETSVMHEGELLLGVEGDEEEGEEDGPIEINEGDIELELPDEQKSAGAAAES